MEVMDVSICPEAAQPGTAPVAQQKTDSAGISPFQAIIKAVMERGDGGLDREMGDNAPANGDQALMLNPMAFLLLGMQAEPANVDMAVESGPDIAVIAGIEHIPLQGGPNMNRVFPQPAEGDMPPFLGGELSAGQTTGGGDADIQWPPQEATAKPVERLTEEREVHDPTPAITYTGQQADTKIIAQGVHRGVEEAEPQHKAQSDRKSAVEVKWAGKQEQVKGDALRAARDSKPESAEKDGIEDEGKPQFRLQVTPDRIGDRTPLTGDKPFALRGLHREEVVRQITEKISVMASARRSEVSMQLKPDSLGRMSFKLEMVDGVLNGRIVVHNSEAKDLIQTNLPQLKDSLEQLGIPVNRLSVNIGGNGDFGQNQFLQEDRQAYNHRANPASYPEKEMEEGYIWHGETTIDYLV